MKKALIFDLDGTLWDAREEILFTWNEVIKASGQGREPLQFQELSDCMGLPMDAIAHRLFPQLEAEEQKKLLEACCREENLYLEEHGGKLFPELISTLQVLQGKYELYIVSNCQCGYIEAFLKAHQLKSYFKDIECWGNTGKMKGDNIKLLMERNEITQALYIGDTNGDQEAATEAGVPFIFCAYGFGETSQFYKKINSFEELKKLPF